MLLRAGQLRKMISTYVGENKEFERQFLSGEIESSSFRRHLFGAHPRGRCRHRRFFTPTGYGSSSLKAKNARDRRQALRARGADSRRLRLCARGRGTPRQSRLPRTARNFNPVMATAARVPIAEVEHLVALRHRPQSRRHPVGIFVKHVVQGVLYEKRIEKRTTRS